MGSKGHGLRSSCDWCIWIRFVCFCVSRFLSCDHNYDWWQWKTLFNFGVRVFVKSAVKWNGYEACYTSLWHVLYFFCMYFCFRCTPFNNSIPIILILQTNKNITAIFVSQNYFANKNHNITCGHCCFLAFHKPVSSHRVGYKSGKSTQRIISWFKT